MADAGPPAPSGAPAACEGAAAALGPSTPLVLVAPPTLQAPSPEMSSKKSSNSLEAGALLPPPAGAPALSAQPTPPAASLLALPAPLMLSERRPCVAAPSADAEAVAATPSADRVMDPSAAAALTLAKPGTSPLGRASASAASGLSSASAAAAEANCSSKTSAGWSSCTACEKPRQWPPASPETSASTASSTAARPSLVFPSPDKVFREMRALARKQPSRRSSVNSALSVATARQRAPVSSWRPMSWQCTLCKAPAKSDWFAMRQRTSGPRSSPSSRRATSEAYKAVMSVGLASGSPPSLGITRYAMRGSSLSNVYCASSGRDA
mmetsp:Transcript_70092/g.217714  ORF Transcript_70092/g.217714 Transcript_70092/m.217714 type:complete len:324 (+) Transcript_70092:65-1036(+)